MRCLVISTVSFNIIPQLIPASTENFFCFSDRYTASTLLLNYLITQATVKTKN